MSRKVLMSVVACFAFAAAAAGQAAEIAKTDALVRGVEAVQKKHKGPELVFADVSDQEATEPKWQKFASEKELDKFRERSETYSIAYCWRRGGKFALATFTFFSGSGDWTNYVSYYYRPNGTLAKVDVEYRTFYGDLILEQDVYFNTAGKQIKKTQRVLDLRSHKPVKQTKEIREQVRSMAEEIDFFKSTSKLPFAKLLK